VVADARACASSVEIYEQLRAHAVDGDGQGWRLGLALLVRQGVAGWMRAFEGLPTPARRIATPAVPVTPGDQPLVAVLASMALVCVAGA
jgi:hypothetical protein